VIQPELRRKGWKATAVRYGIVDPKVAGAVGMSRRSMAEGWSPMNRDRLIYEDSHAQGRVWPSAD